MNDSFEARRRDEEGNPAEGDERLGEFSWNAVRTAFLMLLGDVPGGVTAHHSKGRQYDWVIVGLRPAGSSWTSPRRSPSPPSAARLGDEFANLLYIACTRARNRLCILVDADEVTQAEGQSVDLDYRFVTPDELSEVFWKHGWGFDELGDAHHTESKREGVLMGRFDPAYLTCGSHGKRLQRLAFRWSSPRSPSPSYGPAAQSRPDAACPSHPPHTQIR